MMDRLDAMSVYVAVAETGSLSAAARRLGTPLATVSRKVSELEAHVGARLLDRAGRRATPNEAGRSYAAAAKRILEEVGEAERDAADGLPANLRRGGGDPGVGRLRAPRKVAVAGAPGRPMLGVPMPPPRSGSSMRCARPSAPRRASTARRRAT